MRVWYNEIEPFAADWLENLIEAGHLPAGVVDRRPIQEVRAEDLEPYDQCHFFAGIGGWALALEMAGWGERPVWTGSCPCQPFSQAGKQKGTKDDRHLWPVWEQLVAQRRPPVVFGEQVASPLGRAWLSSVRSEMEALGYGVGAADLCAAGVGSPHIRQRLWWLGELENSQVQRLERRPEGQQRLVSGGGGLLSSGPGDHAGWAHADWIECADGKRRPVEAGTLPLVEWVPAPVGRLRGYGNAIVPQVAAEFIGASMEALGLSRLSPGG